MKIEDSVLNSNKGVIRDYFPNEKIWAFGSRVYGKPKQFSDLDLVIFDEADTTRELLSECKERLSNSDIPILVDIAFWSELSPVFQENIFAKHETF